MNLFIYILLIINFISFITYPLTHEIAELQKSLTILSGSLISTQQNPSYEKLEKVIHQAWKEKNSSLLDEYQQTITMTTAKYLLQQRDKINIKESNFRDYIAFMSMLAEEIIRQYPNKDDEFNIVSLASGDLDNEVLLIATLSHLGYKNNLLIAIDPEYFSHDKKQKYFNFFKNACGKLDITVSSYNPDIKRSHGSYIKFFDNTEQYIKNIENNKFPKNHLLLLIQPGGATLMANSFLEFKNSPVPKLNTNYIFMEKIKNFKTESTIADLYFPYDIKNFFVDTAFSQDEKQISEFVKTYNGRRLIYDLMQKIFEWHPDNTRVYFGTEAALSFVDLLKYTSLDPLKPLAFYIINGRLTRISNISGSFKDVYLRYFFKH